MVLILIHMRTKIFTCSPQKSKAIFVPKGPIPLKFCHLKDSIYIWRWYNFPRDDNLNPAINGGGDTDIVLMLRYAAFKYEHLAQLLYLKYTNRLGHFSNIHKILCNSDRSQGLWRKRGLIEAWKGMSTNWWDHWLPVVTGSFWASCVPSILQATAIITTWPDFYCLGRVCDLWGTSQWSPLDFPDCLITLALVFLTWFSPAVAGSEHMKDVTHWQPRPVSWLVWRLILYGRKRCLVYSSMNTSAWARK